MIIFNIQGNDNILNNIVIRKSKIQCLRHGNTQASDSLSAKVIYKFFQEIISLWKITILSEEQASLFLNCIETQGTDKRFKYLRDDNIENKYL